MKSWIFTESRFLVSQKASCARMPLPPDPWHTLKWIRGVAVGLGACVEEVIMSQRGSDCRPPRQPRPRRSQSSSASSPLPCPLEAGSGLRAHPEDYTFREAALENDVG